MGRGGGCEKGGGVINHKNYKINPCTASLTQCPVCYSSD